MVLITKFIKIYWIYWIYFLLKPEKGLIRKLKINYQKPNIGAIEKHLIVMNSNIAIDLNTPCVAGCWPFLGLFISEMA